MEVGDQDQGILYEWDQLVMYDQDQGIFYDRDWRVMYEWVQACIIGISMSCMSGAQSADPSLTGFNFA